MYNLENTGLLRSSPLLVVNSPTHGGRWDREPGKHLSSNSSAVKPPVVWKCTTVTKQTFAVIFLRISTLMLQFLLCQNMITYRRPLAHHTMPSTNVKNSVCEQALSSSFNVVPDTKMFPTLVLSAAPYFLNSSEKLT